MSDIREGLKFKIAMMYEEFKEQLIKRIRRGEIIRDEESGVTLTEADVRAMEIHFKKPLPKPAPPM